MLNGFELYPRWVPLLYGYHFFVIVTMYLFLTISTSQCNNEQQRN